MIWLANPCTDHAGSWRLLGESLISQISHVGLPEIVKSHQQDGHSCLDVTILN
jgi:hypothetical protein